MNSPCAGAAGAQKPCLLMFIGACCDNALHLGDGLCLCPLWLRCSLWVSALLSMMIQIWLYFAVFLLLFCILLLW